ncbi:hypothetical protein HPB51_015783 [Rhipicephalus microplus]|uniref:Uncharacterized protein n=1 Tax=Rhipicephalus microplus TaxID=6941 RepID=A0A9J6EHN0_RHIMP|nr:hypothetical protein HPB51_015783 [Rhipicephalus microplus]
MSEAAQSAVLCAITDKLLDGTDTLITPNDYAQLHEDRVKRDIASEECSAVEETEAMVELSNEACEEQQTFKWYVFASLYCLIPLPLLTRVQVVHPAASFADQCGVRLIAITQSAA